MIPPTGESSAIPPSFISLYAILGAIVAGPSDSEVAPTPDVVGA